jgi:membrane protein YdbS with pleckstrin-like domain
MADYVDSLIADGETIEIRAKQHWFALIRFAIQPILILIGAIVLFAIGTNMSGDILGGVFKTLLGLLTLALFVLAIVWLPIMIVRWTSRRFILTSRRVLYVDGVMRKRTVDAGLDKITDVGFQQGPIGRQMHFGDLAIVTAAGKPLQFRSMLGASEFKKAILNGQEQLQRARAGVTASAISNALDDRTVASALAPALSNLPAVPATTSAPEAAEVPMPAVPAVPVAAPTSTMAPADPPPVIGTDPGA